MKRILVALDGSPRAVAVLEAAAHLARALGARLVLFRSIGLPAEMPPELWKHPEETLLDVLRKNAQEYLDACAAELRVEVDKKCVEIGTPWQAVCAAARRENADLVVIGSHGYGALDRVLGTTAAKIVNHSDRSVLVVRAPELQERG
jgi:nucleotide-binding universal stress UspA family protein